MNKIAVLTDSGSGMSQAEAKQLGIYVIPLQVIIDDRSYEDGVDIQTSDIYKALSEKKYPKTSAPLYQKIEDYLTEIKDAGFTEVISVPLSSGLSSAYQSIHLAAETIDFKLTHIDCFSTCMIQNHVARLVKQLVDQGKTSEEVKAIVSSVIEGANTLILPNDMDHLKAGGRLTPIAASLANMFKIRPILQLNQKCSGKIDVFAKVRTERKALEQTLETLHTDFEGKDCAIYIIHSDASERTLVTKDLLVEMGYDAKRISIIAISPVIASHTGLDCLGIQFIEDLN